MSEVCDKNLISTNENLIDCSFALGVLCWGYMKKRKTPPKKRQQNLRKTLLEFMAGKRYSPMGQRALFKALALPTELYATCEKIITELIVDDVIVVKRKRLSLKTEDQVSEHTLLGIIRVHQRGFGFVIPEDREKYPQDIFIPKPFIEGAVDGDQVRVEIAAGEISPKGPEGKVLEIVSRSHKELFGTVIDFQDGGTAVLYAPLLGPSKTVLVKKSRKRLKIGDRIQVLVKKWENGSEVTTTELVKKVGSIDDAAIDVKCAILEFQLRDTFPNKAKEEALSFGKVVRKAEMQDRADLTDQQCLTIDPKTARDFDDALYIEKSKSHYTLFVHIADVAAYVKPGSALDREAFNRCNSTYFPGTCVPMLPEELSNNLCSLKEGVRRLTATVKMTFNLKGELLDSQIFRSVIKSKKRFTYEQAKEVLDGQRKSPHAPHLKLMTELCLLLKEQRKARGSVDLSLPELSLQIDSKGMPTGFRLIEYDITHQMVEEFMLKANETVAKKLTDDGKEGIFRIHEEPSEENLEEFYAMVRELGFKLSPKPDQKEIQKLFETAKESPFIQQLSVAFIRRMKLAYYSINNVGHYGLALDHYCHFTSPIRRYSDLITQRLLFENDVAINLDDIVLNCSEKERASFKAEMSVLSLKKLRLLEQLAKTRSPLRASATVTKVKPFGISFDVEPFMLEGFIHVSRLGSDYYIYNDRSKKLIGERTGETFAPGVKIDIELVHIDLVMGECEWRRKKKKN